MGKVDDRLQELGITVPTLGTPKGLYVPYTRTGNLVHIAGQVPFAGGEQQYKGKVGRDVDLAEAQKAARLVGLNLLAAMKHACGGDLDKVVRVVKLNGFVNATEDYEEHPKVINGASELIGEVLGDAGQHARAAVGVASLPFAVPVEIDAIVEIRD
eukprot:TRINITY_DN1574_c0_g1_i4.p1 TRINITY_DN1574_c0_g1~~TRINITY_DN1574_c0_g1_i4.p1  ORF type:complete len:156 (-),score=46.64 TRINITY_DN1574_c0_g1_i4:38-505(-)